MNHYIIEVYTRDNPGQVWRNYVYDIRKPADIAKYIARTRYAWPGGYELFAITDDGDILCNDCCRSEFVNIRTSYPGDGWRVKYMSNMSEVDGVEYCSHCSREIS